MGGILVGAKNNLLDILFNRSDIDHGRVAGTAAATLSREVEITDGRPGSRNIARCIGCGEFEVLGAAGGKGGNGGAVLGNGGIGI